MVTFLPWSVSGIFTFSGQHVNHLDGGRASIRVTCDAELEVVNFVLAAKLRDDSYGDLTFITASTWYKK